jgi:hypothetical protein
VVITRLHGKTAQVLPRLRAKNETARLLSVLESLEARGTLDLDAALRAYCAVPRRGLCVLISDLMPRIGIDSHLAGLRHIGLEPVVMQVLAPEETRPRLEGAVDLVDCETGSTLLTEVSAGALKAYATRLADWTAELESACLAQRTSFIRLLTNEPLEETLFAAIREGRLVQ